MRNLDSFMENGLIETKIWMLGILVIPEESLLWIFSVDRGRKMHVFMYKYEHMYLYADIFILQAYMYACTCHTHTYMYNL